MFGCLRRLLGVALIAAISIAAWHYRDRWWPGASGGTAIRWLFPYRAGREELTEAWTAFRAAVENALVSG